MASLPERVTVSSVEPGAKVPARSTTRPGPAEPSMVTWSSRATGFAGVVESPRSTSEALLWKRSAPPSVKVT